MPIQTKQTESSSLPIIVVIMGDPIVLPGLSFSGHIEQVLLKNEGTMTLETSKADWLAYQHRDTLASIVGHADQLTYLSLIENVPTAKMEQILIERMVNPLQPIGKS